MKPPSLSHSLTFWFGAFVMSYIGWLWWDSMQAKASISVHRLHVVSAGGEIGCIYWPREHPAFTRVWRRAPGEYKILEGLPASMMAVPLKAGEERRFFTSPRLGISGHTVYVPYWILFLSTALVWEALLLWRARRIKRAIADIPRSVEPGSSP